MFQSSEGVHIPLVSVCYPLHFLHFFIIALLKRQGFLFISRAVFVGVFVGVASLQLEAELVVACLRGVDVVQSSPGSVELSPPSRSVVTLTVLCMRGERGLLVYFCCLLLLLTMVSELFQQLNSCE